MENNHVPYIAHEAILARMERMNSRCFVVIIILVVLLFLTNGAWIYYESQYEFVTETTSVTQTSEEGDVNFIGNDGDITNGKADDKEN